MIKSYLFARLLTFCSTVKLYIVRRSCSACGGLRIFNYYYYYYYY